MTTGSIELVVNDDSLLSGSMVNISQDSRKESAIKHLRRADPIMKAMIAEVGPCTLLPESRQFVWPETDAIVVV